MKKSNLIGKLYCIGFITIFEHLVVAYFWGHPVGPLHVAIALYTMAQEVWHYQS